MGAAASLPLVLPPAVTVYYLLAELGRWTLRFHWHAAVAVSAVYTLPLLLRLARTGPRALDQSFENAARSLGAGEFRIFWRVTLPLAWRAVAAAFLAGFARAFVDLAATAMLAAHAPVMALLPVAAAALGAIYCGNRLHLGQVPA